MSTNELLKIMLITLACSFMFIGVYIDKTERRYPNNIVIMTTIIGLIYAHITGRLSYATYMCLAIHLVGIIDICLLGLISAGDWKMFATLMLFTPFERTNVLIVFGCVLLGITVFTKLHVLKKITWSNFVNSMKQEWQTLKATYFLREKISANTEENSLFKVQTLPMTCLFFVSWLVCQILVISGF